MLEEAEVASDLETMDAFLADVSDSMGADEAVFWRLNEQRDTLAPASWSTAGASRPMHFDVGGWSGLVKWAAEARVIPFDTDARVAIARLAAAPVEIDGRLLGELRTGFLCNSARRFCAISGRWRHQEAFRSHGC